MAKYQAAIAAGDILGRDMTVEHVADGANSPRVIFTEPQVAAVGHTTASAAARFGPICPLGIRSVVASPVGGVVELLSVKRT